MSDRTHLERGNTGRSKRAGVWRHARQALALAVVMLMVVWSWPVKVGAAPGNLDASFSANGRLITNFGEEDHATGVAIQANGRIVVAGYTGPVHSRDFAVACYNSNGTLDASFSGDGKQTTDFFGGSDLATAVAIQEDGKIVVAGWGDDPSGINDFALARYNTNGTLDNTFGGDGLVTTDFFGADDLPSDILIQPNGKIVVGGTAIANDFSVDFAVARYNTNGTLDTTFSGDGKQTTNFGDAASNVRAIAIQSNGKIVAAGNIASEADFGLDFDFALARYNTNGTLDTTFSGDGKTTINFGGDSSAYGVALQSTSRIVVAGYVNTGGGNSKFALARYNGNGSLDNGGVGDSTPNDEFGQNGMVTTDFFNGADIAQDVAIQSDDKIVAAGYASHPGRDFAVARYDADGALDNTFSGDGKLTTHFSPVNYNDQGGAVAIQPDGKIVVAGTTRVPNPLFRYDFAVARYLGD